MFCRRILTLAAVGLGLASSGRAVEQKAIDEAIANGVIALRRAQGQEGSWHNPGGFVPGATALAGLTLLECDAKPDDPQVKKAAEFVRTHAPTMTKTYSISTAIMFLDRLGDPGDVPLIESLSVRLLAGQALDGGWPYDCPPISEDEVARLRASIKSRTELKTGQLPTGKRTLKDLPKEIQNQVALVNRMAQQGGAGQREGLSDNSNTQFATLAMWIGRRHGMPVETALARVTARYRRAQAQDGTWHYLSGSSPPGGGFYSCTPSGAMTCAGILALAIGHGLANDPDIRKGQAAPDLAKDVVLKKALVALGTAVGKPGGEAPVIGEDHGKAYYFLWSLERVAVTLNLETIEDKDWYNWGAEILLANQDQQGNWRGAHKDGGTDTCFALLFLRRSNLIKDISANLKGKARDLSKVDLTRGGVGGAAFASIKEIKSPFAKDAKAPEDTRPKDAPKPKAIPSRAEETEEDRLSNKLLEAKGENWERVLAEVRDNDDAKTARGALSLAIAKLEGEPRKKARDALAERMTRLKADALAGYMKDADAEIRRGAVIASGSKGLRSQIPLIIDRLNDGDPNVAYAAEQILKHLTKQDFGPEFGASREDHDKAIKKWKDWWKDNADK